MTLRPFTILGGFALVALGTMAPAMANPNYPRVAVGPLNSNGRIYSSISAAQNYCRQNGCRVTAGVEISQGLWTDDSIRYFSGAVRVHEPETCHPVLLMGNQKIIQSIIRRSSICKLR